MSPNRIVVLLTPVVAVAAGATATWIAENVPGANITAGQLEAVFIAGLAAVVAPAAQWLHGAQKYERHQQDLEQAALEADARAAEGRCPHCGAGHGDDDLVYGDPAHDGPGYDGPDRESAYGDLAFDDPFDDLAFDAPGDHDLDGPEPEPAGPLRR